MSYLIRNSSTCLLVLLLAPVALADEKKTDADTKPASTELSVAPLDHVTFPDDRPIWVSDADNGKPFTMIGDNKIVVVSRLCDTPRQCEELLMVSAKVAADAFVVNLVDFVSDNNFYEFSDEEVEDLITRRHEGTALQGDVKMHQHAVELTFTPEKQRQIKTASRNVEVDRRLRHMSGFLVAGLVALFGSSAVIGTVGRLKRRKAA